MWIPPVHFNPILVQKIGIINGPNLDRLGKREPEIYGHGTLDGLVEELNRLADHLGLSVQHLQSNHEGAIIDQLAAWTDAGMHAFIINPGGLTHTSVALRDAITATGKPTVEVHISNIHAREAFRQKSITAGACRALISGMGFHGYYLALHYLSQLEA